LSTISPWLDFVLILFFFMSIESRIVLNPGVIVELPTTEFVEGVSGGMIAVISIFDSPEGRVEVVFFDDEPYAVDDARMSELKEDFKDFQLKHNDTALTIYADKSITHGTISRIVSMARDIGLERVNMGAAGDRMINASMKTEP
jgi:biopolymer transport protein ExbD